MRLIFMGTPEIAVPALAECLAGGHDVVAVYTRAAKPAGRGLALRASPVALYASARGIAVLTPKTVRTEEEVAQFAAHNADAAIVMAYGLILPRAILEAPRLGCYNLHASLLPRWRGAAPIQRAIMAGDTETGVMLMQMEEGLDTGPVSLAKHCPILPDDTGGVVHDRLAALAADVLREGLPLLAAGTLRFEPQSVEGICYAAKITAADQLISFTAPAHAVHNQIRALNPFPGAYFMMKRKDGATGAGERIKILASAVVEDAHSDAPAGTLLTHAMRVACGDGKGLTLMRLQRAGKTAVSGQAFFNGARLEIGAMLAG